MGRRRAAAALHPGARTGTELWITPNNDSLSITCGHKQYLLPAEDVTVLPLVNTHTALLDQWILSIGLSCGLPTVG